MATEFTFRIESDPASGCPVAWIDADGQPVIRQPHHPNALLDPSDPTVGMWATEPEAAAWAEATCVDLAAQEVAEAEALAQLQAAEAEAARLAEEDRARLVRIEEKLDALLGL